MKKLIAAIIAIMMMAGIAAGVASAEEVKLSREEAMKAVLDYANIKEDQVTFTKVKQDWENGYQIWEIEFISNGIEYDFDVDLYSGRILKADRDRAYDRYDDWDDDRDDFLDDLFDFD